MLLAALLALQIGFSSVLAAASPVDGDDPAGPGQDIESVPQDTGVNAIPPVGEWEEPQPDDEEALFWGQLLGREGNTPSDMMGEPAAEADGGPAAGPDISDEVSVEPMIWINGKGYSGEELKGADITVKVGDSFSYQVSWYILSKANHITNGSTLRKLLFKVPGLNLPVKRTMRMVIGGIYIGDYTLSYAQKTGEMVFSATFNQFAAYFDPDTISGLFRGNGQFQTTGENQEITLGDKAEGVGHLTVEERPTQPPVTLPATGVGWKPALPPTFLNRVYGFGKGLKWYGEGNGTPELEWRVVFLNHLQSVQNEFQADDAFAFPTYEKYCIIEETLDENQKFYAPPEAHDNKYTNNTPFFIELPVIVPDTGTILNAAGTGVGGGDYNGNGYVTPVIRGDKFSPRTSREDVEKLPLTWTIETDPATGRETLIINVGRLGTADPQEGIVYSMGWGGGEWQNTGTALTKYIQNCENKILALEVGADSPITLLDKRTDALIALLTSALGRPDNKEQMAEAQAVIEAYNQDYETWYTRNATDPLRPVEVGPPDRSPLQPLESLIVNGANGTLGAAQVYLDWIASVDHLVGDQDLYLQNRLGYVESWKRAKADYESTQAFYHEGRVYGFILKLRTQSINTSVTSYSNSAQLSWGDTEYQAENSSTARFNSAITGNYQHGSIVMQKADQAYVAGGKEDLENIQDLPKGAGLAGAEFQVYCGTAGSDEPGELNKNNLAHFLPKAASENKDTYRYLHSGEQGRPVDDTQTVVTNSDGRLILSNLSPEHLHWLVETKAPAGYYLDKAPIPLKIDTKDIVYKMLPNIARAVRLEKTDARTDRPLPGAEFQLVQQAADGTPLSFTSKTIDGVTVYWPTDKVNQAVPLKTDAAGQLRIHGLEAGTYTLSEKMPAPGYQLPDSQAAPYTFTLTETLPEDAEADENGFYYVELNNGNPVENTPQTAPVTLNKQDGQGDGLSGAVFALLEWTGTAAQWEENPNALGLWKPVAPQGADSAVAAPASGYFITENKITEEIPVPTELQPLIGSETVTGIETGQDGTLTIREVPAGHFLLVEVRPPNGYQQNDQRFYFDVIAPSADGVSVPLYRGVNGQDRVEGNVVHNYRQPAKFALVKYAAGTTAPNITGGEQMPSALGSGWHETADGWKYQGAVIESDKGLCGAMYKLFIQMGEQPNPIESALNAKEEYGGYNADYDPCVAYGRTDGDGVLSWERMIYRTEFNNTEDGIPLMNYYLVEVAPPDGFVLNAEPILLPLDGRTIVEKLPDGENQYVPGLIKRVSNETLGYGISITKTDAGAKPPEDLALAGAAFTIETEDGLPLPVTKVLDGRYKLDEKSAVTEMETDSSGKLVILGVEQGQTYRLTETRTPQGFQKPDTPFTITVGKDGPMIAGVVLTEKPIPNERLKGAMVLYKKDREGMKPLADAKFQLYHYIYETISPDDPDYNPDKPDALRAVEKPVGGLVTSDANGRVAFTDLEWDEYYFAQEVEAPPGYLLDESSLQFQIDQYSFTQDGKPIVVTFPAVFNMKGNLGEVLLRKVDSADETKGIPNAQFFLMKNLSSDPLRPNWGLYGKELYTTDETGEIRLPLPPGDYQWIEVLPGDGFLYPETLFVPLPFTILDLDEGEPPLIEITVPNDKGACGLSIAKYIAGTQLPIPGVTFRFYRGADNIVSGTPVPLYFIKNKNSGVYTCVTEGTPGASPDVVTDADGRLRLTFPEDFILSENASEKEEQEKAMAYEEVSAPPGVELSPGITRFEETGWELKKLFWETGIIYNPLTTPGSYAIELLKTDENQQPLPGAEFELYQVTRAGNGTVTETLVDQKTTDASGRIMFSGLVLGGEYYCVESKAPAGFKLDKTHHEVVIDSSVFPGGYQTAVPIRITVTNSTGFGWVHLEKVEEGSSDKGLAGAGFELFKQNPERVWEHYGDELYYTDQDGKLDLELPYGSFYWIERKAPTGYLLGQPAELHFTIDDGKTDIKLGPIENAVNKEPHGSVELVKRDASAPSTPLPGAEFHLFWMGADGKWHLWSEETYTSDEAGRIQVEWLPIGTFCFREVKAPPGYVLDTEREHRFTIDRDGARVLLTVTNRKETGPSGGSDGPEDPAPPTKPEPPTDPTQPPVAPPASGIPETPGTPGQPVDGDPAIPQTGQNRLLGLILALCGATLLALGLAGAKKRRCRVVPCQDGDRELSD